MSKLFSFLAVMLCLGLTACATTQSAQVGFVQACTAYKTSFATILQLRDAGKLTAVQISAINTLDSQVTPLCTGEALPASPDAATAQITAAVTTLAATIAVQQGAK